MIRVLALVCCLVRLSVQAPREQVAASLGRAAASKVVVDTDAGADDAVALLLALGHGASQLLGVTCVHGNTHLRNVQANVLKTLHAAARLEIPVYKGSAESILQTPPTDNFFGQDGFGDFRYPESPSLSLVQEEHAVLALIRLARENKGELTVLCLGPLTNIALAIRMDPSFINNLQNLVVLGGSVEGWGNVAPGIEFNFYMDPEAVHIVLEACENKALVLVPWESVYRRNLIDKPWRMETLGQLPSGGVKLLNQAERVALSKNPQYWVSADPIAAAVALRPDLVLTSTPYRATAEVHGAVSRGAIFLNYEGHDNATNNVIVVENIDLPGYKSMLLKNLAI